MVREEGMVEGGRMMMGLVFWGERGMAIEC